MEEQNRYWQNKVFIGRGTLRDFSGDYDKISCADRMFVTASQLFPTGKLIENDCADKGMEYEYVIYYKAMPADNRKFNKNGKVIVDITEKEGRAMDKDVKEEMEVVI